MPPALVSRSSYIESPCMHTRDNRPEAASRSGGKGRPTCFVLRAHRRDRVGGVARTSRMQARIAAHWTELPCQGQGDLDDLRSCPVRMIFKMLLLAASPHCLLLAALLLPRSRFGSQTPWAEALAPPQSLGGKVLGRGLRVYRFVSLRRSVIYQIIVIVVPIPLLPFQPFTNVCYRVQPQDVR
jgi:hypothetical protein